MSINIKGKTNIGPNPEQPSIYYVGGFENYNINSNRLVTILTTGGTVDNTFNVGDSFWNQFSSQPYILTTDVQSDGKIIVGGRLFLYSSTTTNNIARLNTNGSLDTSLVTGSGFNSIVNNITIQPDGKILICGAFTSYNGVTSNRIIRLNSDGSIDSGFVIGTGFGFGGSGPKTISLQSDGKIIVGGPFTTYSGVTSNRIIRLNSDGSIDNTFNVGSGFNDGFDLITTLQSDGKILVGGFFTTYSGVTSTRIIRLNSDGSIDNTFNVGTGFNNGVENIKVNPDGKIIVGGFFTTYSGVTSNRIIRLNSDGSIDNTFNVGSGFNNTVRNVHTQSDGKVLVVGAFTSYQGITANRVIRLNNNGSIDNTFVIGSGFDSDPETIKILPDNRIIIAGNFNYYNTTNASRILKTNQDGYIDTPYYTNSFDNSVSFIELQEDQKIILVGPFTTYSGITTNNILRLNDDGSIDNTFVVGSGFNNPAMTGLKLQPDGKVLVGGNFSSYQGITRNRIIRLNTNGSIDNTFNIGSGFNNAVTISLSSDGKILIGGVFTSYNGITNNRIIRLNSDGSIDNTFITGTGFDSNTGVPYIQSDGKIIVGGFFATYSGVTRNRIIRLNTDGSIDNTFNIGTGFNAVVRIIKAQSDGKILVSGDFTSYNGVAKNKLVRLNSNGSIDNTFNALTIAGTPIIVFDVDSLDRIIISGDFQQVNGVRKNRIARLNRDGTLDNTFKSGTGLYNSGVSSILFFKN